MVDSEGRNKLATYCGMCGRFTVTLTARLSRLKLARDKKRRRRMAEAKFNACRCWSVEVARQPKQTICFAFV